MAPSKSAAALTKPKLPDNFASQKISRYTSAKLREFLDQADVPYSGTARKPELQASYILFLMGIAKPDITIDEDLLEIVESWCEGLASELHDEIAGRGLEIPSNKWKCIELLLQDDIEEAERAKETRKKKEARKIAAAAKAKAKENDASSQDTAQPSSSKQPHATKPKKTQKAAVAASQNNAVASSSKQPEEAELKHPASAVMNLLIGTIFADIAKDETVLATAYPTCPIQDKKNFLKLLDKVPAFQNNTEVSKMLDDPKAETEQLISWIASTFGRMIIPAEEEWRIPGFTYVVEQFVLAQPRSNLNQDWEKCYEEDGGKSTLLFHGTAFVHLQSILHSGFYPSADHDTGLGVFLATEPSMSDGFAAHFATKASVNELGERQGDVAPLAIGWSNDPFADRRLLLGVEATGAGRMIEGGVFEKHVVERLKSVMTRYIFLLGPAPGEQVPSRNTAREAMVDGFKRIREGLEV